MDGTKVPSKPVVYIGSQELAKISSLLPSNQRRSVIVHSLINSLGLMSNSTGESKRRLRVVTPQRATRKDLAVYHTEDYLDMVLTPLENPTPSISADADFGLEDDCPLFAGLSEYVELVAGATLTAARALQQDLTDISICWDGGRHHARKSQASGFCYVADCILAILALKKPLQAPLPSGAPRSQSHQRPRVMYLDLDLHFSDAVSEAFYSPRASVTSQILTLSIHHSSPGFYPASELGKVSDAESDDFDPFTLSIPLLQGASAVTYANIWPIVERIKDVFKPSYTIVQCGTDALAGDPCATFNWSLGNVDGSMGWCIRQIMQWPGKKLLLGGGGYNSPNTARAWAYLTSIALDDPLDLSMEIPDHVGFPLYAPSFTLDVPAGNMIDQNYEDYLTKIHANFEGVITALENKFNY
ncbi:histone deacetylase complex protein [Agrocybe pediades]|nr:histone deacetylase complex protein [Agrocybe pediades]